MTDMSWIELIWPMIGAACFTLAAIHLVIWMKGRHQHANFMFALTSVSVGIVSILELFLMHANTPQQYENLVRWGHVPVVTMVVGIVGFVLIHFRAGSVVLAGVVCVTRIATLIPNALSGANLNFKEVKALQALPVWGGDFIVVPLQAIPNPWMWMGRANAALLVLYLATVVFQVWRRGVSHERRSVVLVCGSLVAFSVFATGWTSAVVEGYIDGPMMFSPTYLFVLLIMGYQLGRDVLQAESLSSNLSVSKSRLQDTQRRMDQAVNAGGLGLWNLDLASGEPWISARAGQLMELRPEDGANLAELVQRIHPDDRHCIDDLLREAAAGSDEFNGEFRIELANGEMRWLHMRGQVDFDDKRAPLRAGGVLADITGRKVAEERFCLAVEMAPTAMLMCDPQGAIIVANQQAEALFGFSHAELIGMPSAGLWPARFRRGTDDGWWKFLITPHTRDAGGDLFGLRKDGREVPIDIALTEVPMQGGTGLLASVTDLSERNRLEQEAALQRDELAHLARVVLLAELSSSLAHELNQPLTAILSNAQAALRFLDHAPPNLDEVRDSLVNIVESDKRAGEVIRRLRALLRKDRAQYEILDVNEVVRDVLRIMRIDLMNARVEVVTELAGTLTSVLGDKVQLQQVLLNLVKNASDAMKDLAQDRHITVRTMPAPDGGVEVSVSDVGSGISGDDIQHIFVPFVTTKAEGLGLGLPVCMTIVDAHGGSLWAANNADAGATVGFRLPANTILGSVPARPT